MGRAIGTTGTSDATRIQPLPSNCIDHVRCTGRDAHAAGLPVHLSNCWSLSDRHQPLCGLCSLACAPKHAVFLMRLSRAASSPQQADQRRNRSALWVWACAWRCSVGRGRLLCGCALRSSPVAFGALQMNAVGWAERLAQAPQMRREFSRCRATASAVCGEPAVMRMRRAYQCT